MYEIQENHQSAAKEWLQSFIKYTKRVSISNLCRMCMISTINRSISSSGFRMHKTYHRKTQTPSCKRYRSNKKTKSTTSNDQTACKQKINIYKGFEININTSMCTHRINNYICQLICK